MKFCQFCGGLAVIVIERILDGKPLPVCEKCLDLSHCCNLYRRPALPLVKKLRKFGGNRGGTEGEPE